MSRQQKPYFRFSTSKAFSTGRSTHIVFKKERVGLIIRYRYDQNFTVMVKVSIEPTESDPCPWYWYTFETKFTTDEEAKAYVLEHWEEITKMGLYLEPKAKI